MIDNEITSVMDEATEAEARKNEAQKKEAQRKAHICKLHDAIERARKHDRDIRECWADDRRVARGESDWLVHTNLVNSIMEVLAAFLYAKNPDVSVKPSQSANRAMLEEYRAVSETLEIVVSRMLKDGNLKRTAKRWVRQAMTVGVGWIKVAMQRRMERDPLVEEEINDLQENVARIQALKAEVGSGEADDYDAKLSQIEANMTALQGRLERMVADGLVLDLMAPEDVVISPECNEVEAYLNSPWIAFDMYKAKESVISIGGLETPEQLKKLEEANLFRKRPRKGESDDTTGRTWVQSPVDAEDHESESDEGFYRVIEIWHKLDGVVYTLVDGVKEEWLREPYAPVSGRRFYPCFQLGFHYIDGERYPQSDVKQLKELQEEYNRTRSNFSEHRRRAIPGVMFDATQIEETSIKKLEKSSTQEYTPIRPLTTGVPLQNLFAPKLYNQVDPYLYNTDPITQEMEKVSGAQDAVQGGMVVEKTATEAQIQETGRGARTGARLDYLEEALTEMAEYVAQLALLTMDAADAQRYAGPDAVWPELTVEEAHTLFNIEIKAGSTGKPKAATDRDAWGVLMPLLEGMIDRVGHARMQGQEWAAKPWIALLNESFQRLDDHADIERFLPVPPPEVIQASQAQGQPTEMEKSEIAENEAQTLDKLASALEKNPLFVTPAMQVMAKLRDEGTSGPEQAEGLPPAPNPLSTDI